jgi:hypothetical protein
MHNNAKHAQQDLCLLILKHVNKFVEMDWDLLYNVMMEIQLLGMVVQTIV